ncbi:MAG: hypothetical protein ABSF21_00400 [Dehalococcoidia bacterium]|jgi:hypothetical protein
MAKSPRAQEVFVANSDGIYCDNVILLPNQPKQRLPGHEVPPGMHVLIKSDPGNPLGSIVYVDGHPVGSKSWPLVPNEEVAYRVNNTDAIFVGVLGAIAGQLIIDYTLEAD